MDTNFNLMNQGNTAPSSAIAKTFISNVFSWMAAALIITGIVAYQFNEQGLISYLINTTENGTRMSGLGYVVMFAPLGFVLLISAGFNRFSSTILLALFLAFSVLMGMSLSFIFLMYTQASIFKTFAIAGAMFGTMAVLGYTTKTDLTKFGSIMMMGLIGIIIASLINMFMHSGGFDYIISFFGVVIFTGLTAYDVQKIKAIGSGDQGQENNSKLAIMGALTLYMDFINLFLFLLRFFGNRRD